MKRILLFCLSLLLVLCLAGCSQGGYGTEMIFSTDSSELADFFDTKEIYIGENVDELVLSFHVKIKEGTAVVSLRDAKNHTILAEQSVEEDATFALQAEELQGPQNLIVVVEGIQVKKLTVTLSTYQKLMREPEAVTVDKLDKPKR